MLIYYYKNMNQHVSQSYIDKLNLKDNHQQQHHHHHRRRQQRHQQHQLRRRQEDFRTAIYLVRELLAQ